MKPKKLGKLTAIRLSMEDYEWLKKMAAKDDRSVANYIRRIIHAARMNGSSKP